MTILPFPSEKFFLYLNEELYELNVIDKPFRFPDESPVIWKSQAYRINGFINRWEKVKILICEFGLILFFWISCECERILDIFHDAWKDNIFLYDWVLQKSLGDSPYWWSGRAE